MILNYIRSRKLLYFLQLLVILLLLPFLYCDTDTKVNKNFENKFPTVTIAFLARNKAHTLPYFLTLLQNLQYPKDRIALWVRSDHNEDNTIEILKKWLNTIHEYYHSIDSDLNEDFTKMDDERGPAHWSSSRFNHVISLRESALNYARRIWSDYIMMIDSDVFLSNPNTLRNLIEQNHIVTAPLLKSDGLYSNFWCGMTSEYYYERTDSYKPILNRENVGCFPVPMVHSSVIIDLRVKISDQLTFLSDKVHNYDGPKDDIITFAISANKSEIAMYVCNDQPYGYVMVPLEQNDELKSDLQQFTNLKLEIMNEEKPLYYSDLFNSDVIFPEKDKLGFSEIFMINLLRRPERRRRMNQCFDELGLNVTMVDAVDGRSLNDTILREMGIGFMPEFSDPYHKRPMTLGEIGCFLSHYNIWLKILENEYASTMVLEDDIRFEPYFRLKVLNIMKEAEKLGDWDLIYLGRKRLVESNEPWVSRYLVQAGYSYWTLGYVLSYRGAQKLLNGQPLKNMVPVDEYLPILFDKHPKDNWKGYFPQRDLIAYSAAPLLLYPTHYTGEKGYVSDTEDSKLIPSALIPGESSISVGLRDDL